MNKRVVWIIELVLWLIFATTISFLLVFYRSYQNQQVNSYYLFFSDVDGLMKGSPVKLMGMQIGYVQEIKVFDDSVFVSFLVTKKNVKVPEKATASVEFYGLGGSKSLEIVPNSAINDKKEKQLNDDSIIITKEPYRIQDFYDVQSSIARLLVKMTNSFTNIIQENEIYKTRTFLKMSSKLNGVNTKVIDVQNNYLDINNTDDEDKINEKKHNQEKNNASTND